MKKFLKIFAVLAICFFSIAPVSAYYSPGAPTGYVNDFAKLMTDPIRSALELELSQFEKTTGHEIGVVTITSLKDDYIENFAVKLFEEYKFGKEKADNGVLFLISKDDRKMRIEVGYGLEGALTDLQSRRILDEVAAPKFKENNYDAGIVAAVAEIEKAVKGEPFIGQNETETKSDTFQEVIFGIAFAVFYLFAGILASKLGKSKRWWPGGVIGIIIGAVIGLIFGSALYAVISAIMFGGIGFGVDYGASQKGWFKPGKDGKGGFWGGSSGGSSGGFGGFGGGSSGGGGSSSSW